MPGDLEAALVAGLGVSKKNRAVRAFVKAGRPQPTGMNLQADENGVVSVKSSEKVETGHVWHGREVVEYLISSGGLSAVQVCPEPTLFGCMDLFCLTSKSSLSQESCAMECMGKCSSLLVEPLAATGLSQTPALCRAQLGYGWWAHATWPVYSLIN